MTKLVTGATGFIGSRLCSQLIAKNYETRAVVRFGSISSLPSRLQKNFHIVEKIGPETDWSDILPGIDTIIHCAACSQSTSEMKFRELNVEGTKRLAEHAAAAGVKRFIYLSSIKVNGEETFSGSPFTFKDKVEPEDAYSVSKLEAEQALYEISLRNDLEVIVIRPPLVYGPGVKGNFLSMLNWLNLGVPLPLGAVHNQRSIVNIDNLIDLIIKCIDHPAAPGQVFLVSDEQDISTTELVYNLGKMLGKPARLIPVSSSLLNFGATILGKQDVAKRLLGNLQIDISHTKSIISWKPPVSMHEGLKKTAEWYLSKK